MIYAARKFIGRESELALLENWLQEVESPQCFLAVTGIGGIGKSQLIEKFANSKRVKKNADTVTTQLIDLYWTAHQTEIGILRNLASQLGNEATFSSFNKLLGKNESGPDIFDEVRDAFFEAYKQLGRNRVLFVFDTLEKASDSAIRFFTQTAPQLKTINPNTHFLAAGRWLPDELANCNFVRKLQLGGLDAADFSIYLSQVVEERKINEDVIERVHTVTNGRPMWAGLFADWTNAGNEPTAIDTTSFEAFRENVLQPLSELHEPEDTLILAMAHLNRRCNERILSHVLSGTAADLKIDIPEVVKKLSRFSFVKFREPIDDDLGSCLLHDEMCDLVLDHLWSRLDVSGNYRKKLSRKVVDYYNEEIKRAEINKHANILDLQDLNAERLYYLFDVNPHEAFDSYMLLFENARYTDVREELNNEVAAAQDALGFSLKPFQHRQRLLRLAQVDHQRERYAGAIKKLLELNEDRNCELELLANTRKRLVMAYTLNSQLREAIDSATEWISWLQALISNAPNHDPNRNVLIQQLASLHSQLGQAYRKRGKSDIALESYTKALRLYTQSGIPSRDEVASTRVNLAFVYLELGKESDAIEQCRAALLTYEHLGDPYQLGRTHNVLGLIHDGNLREDVAKVHFNKAMRYFKDAKSRRGQGMCQIAQARMIRREQFDGERTGRLKPDEEESKVNYVRVGELLDAAVANLKEGDRALLAVALNEKGTLLRERKQLDEAIRLFEESNKIAREIGNKHRIADNLHDMAVAHYYKGEMDVATNIANEAVEMSKDDYPQVSGRARRTIASVLFDKGNYDAAFEVICLSCTEIVKIDSESLSDSPERKRRLYEEWLDWILGLLRKLPSNEERKSRICQLTDCWNSGKVDDKPLNEVYPSFIIALETLAVDDC